MADRKFVWICDRCTLFVGFDNRSMLEDHFEQEHEASFLIDYHVISKDEE
jgi:hypothetical protein